MYKRSEGPSELIGREGDKGGLLQKRSPGEMVTQARRRRRRGERDLGRWRKGSGGPFRFCDDAGGYSFQGSYVLFWWIGLIRKWTEFV